jgi:hypothetical protein
VGATRIFLDPSESGWPLFIVIRRILNAESLCVTLIDAGVSLEFYLGWSRQFHIFRFPRLRVFCELHSQETTMQRQSPPFISVVFPPLAHHRSRASLQDRLATYCRKLAAELSRAMDEQTRNREDGAIRSRPDKPTT